MALNIKHSESADQAISRICAEQIDASLTILDGEDPHHAVHEVRKNVKTIRAALRLIRQGLGKKEFDRDNDFLRQIGHRLTAARESAVMVQTFEDLTAEAKLGKDVLDRIHDELVARRDAALHDATRGGFGQLRKRLTEACSRLEDLNATGDGWESLMAGLRRSYKRGRQAMDCAASQPTHENYHAWRRRVKDLGYQMRMVEPLWPEAMAQVQKHLDELASELGDDHDLGTLDQRLREEPDTFGAPKTLKPLFDAIDEQRQLHRQRAHEIGSDLYDDKPKAFIERFEALLQIW